MTYLHTLETSTGDAAISGIKHSANDYIFAKLQRYNNCVTRICMAIPSSKYSAQLFFHIKKCISQEGTSIRPCILKIRSRYLAAQGHLKR